MGKTKVDFKPLNLTLDPDQQLKELGVEGVNHIKSISPVNKRKYANGFVYRLKDHSILIYNAGKEAWISHFLEFGTGGKKGQAPQPHYEPTFRYLEKRIVDIFSNIDIEEK